MRSWVARMALTLALCGPRMAAHASSETRTPNPAAARADSAQREATLAAAEERFRQVTADAESARQQAAREIDRLRAASSQRLAADGIKVDWKHFSLDQLHDLERRLAEALVLRAYGITVDWTHYPLADLRAFRSHAERERLLGTDDDTLAPGAARSRRAQGPSPRVPLGKADPDALLEPRYRPARLLARAQRPDPDSPLPPSGSRGTRWAAADPDSILYPGR